MSYLRTDRFDESEEETGPDPDITPENPNWGPNLKSARMRHHSADEEDEAPAPPRGLGDAIPGIEDLDADGEVDPFYTESSAKGKATEGKGKGKAVVERMRQWNKEKNDRDVVAQDWLVDWLSEVYPGQTQLNYTKWCSNKDMLSDSVAKQMGKEGFCPRTGKQVKDQINKLNTAYKAARDLAKPSGGGKEDDDEASLRTKQLKLCPHWDDLRKVFGNRIGADPKAVHESTSANPGAASSSNANSGSPDSGDDEEDVEPARPKPLPRTSPRFARHGATTRSKSPLSPSKSRATPKSLPAQASRSTSSAKKDAGTSSKRKATGGVEEADKHGKEAEGSGEQPKKPKVRMERDPSGPETVSGPVAGLNGIMAGMSESDNRRLEAEAVWRKEDGEIKTKGVTVQEGELKLKREQQTADNARLDRELVIEQARSEREARKDKREEEEGVRLRQESRQTIYAGAMKVWNESIQMYMGAGLTFAQAKDEAGPKPAAPPAPV